MKMGRIENDKLILGRIKENLPELKNLLKTQFDEDISYRFYHQSFKVYFSQGALKAAQKLFENIAGDEFKLNKWWSQIVSEALEIGQFDLSHNKDWLEKTRPQMEAFFHTKNFIEAMIKSAEELDNAPNMLPSYWALVLYLFNSR